MATVYCPTRRNLEEHGWFLTSRLAQLTNRLMKIIGQDHEAFLALRTECRTTRLEIHQSHRHLREHRRKHGC